MSKLIEYYIMPYFKGVFCSEFYSPLQFESRQVKEMCDAWNFQVTGKGIIKSWAGGGGLTGVGMLVISLRGVNFGFWSHLGCSGQNAIIFSREGLV